MVHKEQQVLHEDKFEYICHGFNRKSLLIELPFANFQYQYTTPSGATFAPVSQLRDLGIPVSSNLSWSARIRYICNTLANGSLGDISLSTDYKDFDKPAGYPLAITAKYGCVITAVWNLALSIISVKAFRQTLQDSFEDC